MLVTGATGLSVPFSFRNSSTQPSGGRLSRADAGAEALTFSADDLNDLDRLRTAGEAAARAIHRAFHRDFSHVKEHSADDRKLIKMLGEVLAGPDRPLVIASGLEKLRHPQQTRDTLSLAGAAAHRDGASVHWPVCGSSAQVVGPRRTS